MRVLGTLALQGADTQAPTTPANFSATAISAGRVDLAWNASTDNVGVTGYQVWRNGSPLDTTTGTTFSDTTTQPSTQYTYTVSAFDGAGNASGLAANQVVTTPANAAPSWTNPGAQTLIVGDSYTLNLASFVTDADEDTLTYGIVSGTLPTGITRNGSIVSGTPTVAGQTPTVVFSASDEFASIDQSVTFSTFNEDVTAPPVPTGQAANATDSSSINLSWTASTDAAGSANEFVSGTQDYRIYRSTDQTNFSLRTTVTGTSYQDTGLAASTRYDYKITARDAALNESAQSTAVNATTTAQSGFASAEADWRFRTGQDPQNPQPGVTWFHDFRYRGEVDQFRWANGYGSDPLDLARPNQTIWVGSDGITGGCLESRHLTGAVPNPPDFWRPMAPLNGASNGRGVDDPAANSTLTVRNYAVTDGGNTSGPGLLTGVYGHSTYHAAEPAGTFDGTSYFFQMRVTISANRINFGEGGKLLYFTNCRRSNSAQELVTNSYFNVTVLGSGNLFQMYRSGGTGLPDDVQTPPQLRQIGGEYNGGVCRSSPTVNSSGCWFWPLDETSEGAGDPVTLLYEVVPGTDNGDNSIVRVWKAEWGETSYTKIWDQSDVDLRYDNDMPFGHNAIILSGYQNEHQFTQEVWHRYKQVIHSKAFIPCPQYYEPRTAIEVACRALGSNQSAAFSPGTTHGLSSAQIDWQGRFFHDALNGVIQLMGKAANDPDDWRLRTLNLRTGVWSDNDFNFQRNGHIYGSVDLDPATGDLYMNPGAGDFRDIWRRPYSTGTWTQVTTELSGGVAVSGPLPLVWHPHLFGQNDGGTIVLVHRSGTDRACFWRKSTNTVSTVSVPTDGVLDTSGQGCYFRSLNIAIVGRPNNFRIAPGVPPAVTHIGAPPVPMMGTGTSSITHGVVMQHPGNPYKLLLLEKLGTNRVWTSTNGASWTLVSGVTHPFVSNSTSPITFCSLEGGLGCVWGIGETGDVLVSRLWRPPV